MTLNDALNQIIDDGIEAARADYTKPDQRLQLEGSIQGFEECRGKTPSQIAALIDEANARDFEQARDVNERGGPAEQYWFWRCRTLEIEWVANVLGNVMLANNIEPLSRRLLTYRGAMKAAEIIGVREVS